MFTAPVRVDRAVEGQVWRAVASDDGLGCFDTDFSTLRERDFLIPAVILDHRAVRREAVVRIARSTAATHGEWSGHKNALYTVFIYSIEGDNQLPEPSGAWHCRADYSAGFFSFGFGKN